MAKQKRRIYCKFCDYFCYTPEDYVSHLEKHHDEMIPLDMTAWQFSYYLRTGKTKGSCIMCKKDTTWNEKTHKYNRFCKNPKCKEQYRDIFKDRMIGKYGKTHLLNDPEQQKKMLANRKISGEYTWRDHVTKTTYTGSYEKNFLEFLDEIMNFDPLDIMAPSPHTYFYDYEGEKHFYIPDFFIPSLDLEIEIKDGGDNVNQHPKIQAVDKVKEKLKDEVMLKNHFNYIKITNQNHEKFFEYLNKAKEQFNDKNERPIYMIESGLTLENLNELYTESVLLYEKDTELYFAKGSEEEKNIRRFRVLQSQLKQGKINKEEYEKQINDLNLNSAKSMDGFISKKIKNSEVRPNNNKPVIHEEPKYTTIDGQLIATVQVDKATVDRLQRYFNICKTTDDYREYLQNFRLLTKFFKLPNNIIIANLSYSMYGKHWQVILSYLKESHDINTTNKKLYHTSDVKNIDTLNGSFRSRDGRFLFPEKRIYFGIDKAVSRSVSDNDVKNAKYSYIPNEKISKVKHANDYSSSDTGGYIVADKLKVKPDN